jgi:hypothetical protein
MITKLNPSCSHIHWCKFCINIRSVNISHLGTEIDTSFKIMVSWPPSMVTSLLNSMKIYKFVQKLLLGDSNGRTDGRTDREEGNLISLIFLFSRKEAKKKENISCFLYCTTTLLCLRSLLHCDHRRFLRDMGTTGCRCCATVGPNNKNTWTPLFRNILQQRDSHWCQKRDRHGQAHTSFFARARVKIT